MPVSVVCEKAANNVNAALKESLGRVCIGSNGDNGSTILVTKTVNGNVINSSKRLIPSITYGTSRDIDKSLHSRLTTNVKSSLLNNLDYEELNDGVLDKYKNKYFALKRIAASSGVLCTNKTHYNYSNNGRTIAVNGNNKVFTKCVNGNIMGM